MSSKRFVTFTTALVFAACGGSPSAEAPAKKWPDLVLDVPGAPPPGICPWDFRAFAGRRGGVLLAAGVSSPEGAVFRQLDCETGAISVTGTVAHQPDEHFLDGAGGNLTRQGTFMLHLFREGAKAPYPTVEVQPDGTVLGMTRGYPGFVDESGTVYRPDGVATATGTGFLVKPEVSDYLTRNLTSRLLRTAHGLVLEDKASSTWAFVQADRITPLPLATGRLPIPVPGQEVDRIGVDELTPTSSGCEIALNVLDLPQLSVAFRGTFVLAASCENLKAQQQFVFSKILRTTRGTTAELYGGSSISVRNLSEEPGFPRLFGFAPEGGPARAVRPGSVSFADDVAVYGEVQGPRNVTSWAVLDPTTLVALWPRRMPFDLICSDILRYEGLRGGPLPTAYPELQGLCSTACYARSWLMRPREYRKETDDELDTRITTSCDRLAGFDPSYRAGCPFCAR